MINSPLSFKGLLVCSAGVIQTTTPPGNVQSLREARGLHTGHQASADEDLW